MYDHDEYLAALLDRTILHAALKVLRKRHYSISQIAFLTNDYQKRNSAVIRPQSKRAKPIGRVTLGRFLDAEAKKRNMHLADDQVILLYEWLLSEFPEMEQLAPLQNPNNTVFLEWARRRLNLKQANVTASSAMSLLAGDYVIYRPSWHRDAMEPYQLSCMTIAACPEGGWLLTEHQEFTLRTGRPLKQTDTGILFGWRSCLFAHTVSETNSVFKSWQLTGFTPRWPEYVEGPIQRITGMMSAVDHGAHNYAWPIFAERGNDTPRYVKEDDLHPAIKKFFSGSIYPMLDWIRST